METKKLDTRDQGLNLDIHGKATIRVEPGTPSLDILATMFAPFITDQELINPDITVRSQHGPIPDASHNEDEYRYDHKSVWLSGMDVQVSKDGSAYTVSGTRELLTAILPLVDDITSARGAAMIHATMVEINGQGVLMPAWGGVGKTSTMAKLLKHPGCLFMGDDWGFVTDSGTLLAYGKPMFIKPHHRTIYPHLFTGRRKPLIPSRFSRPIGRLTTLVHPVATKFPKLAAFSRRWSPEHKMVTPEQAFPGMPISTEAPFSVSMFAERHDGSTVELESKSTEWMVDRLVGNFYCEMSQHSRDLVTALSATGLAPMHAAMAAKAAVVGKGLQGVPCFLLRVPAEWSADQASDRICEELLAAAANARPLVATP